MKKTRNGLNMAPVKMAESTGGFLGGITNDVTVKISGNWFQDNCSDKKTP